MIEVKRDALETLRQVNKNLRSGLARLRPEFRHCSTVEAQDLSEIISEIQRARECLQGSSPTSEATVALEAEALRIESIEYLSNLEKLNHFLPDLRANLLAERARLEIAQTHVAATAAWARASKKIL